MLLIVDYIWSWARDIYRTTVRNLIANSRISFRTVSPVSTDRLRYSISLCPTSSLAHDPQDLDGIQTDGTGAGCDRSQRQESTEPVFLQDATSHPFLRWAVGHPDSPSWTALGSIRHANIVQLEFQYHDHCAAATSREEDMLSNEDQLSKSGLKDYSIRISREQLNDIAFIWGTRNQSAWGFGLAHTMRATFYFKTYCSQSSWQIKRVLHCNIWEEEQLPLSRHSNTEELMRAMLKVRNIHGRESAWLALRSTDLILRPTRGDGGLEWVTFTDSNLTEKASDILSGHAAGRNQGIGGVCRVRLDNGLFWTGTVLNNRDQCLPASCGKDNRTGDCLLAIRSSSWPDTVPKFCLFVPAETDYESGSELLHFLNKAVSEKSFCGDKNCQLSNHDRRALYYEVFKWRAALTLERTNTA